MKKFFLILPIIFFLLVNSVSALYVQIYVKGEIKGKPGYLNFTSEGNFQKILLDWENTGSSSCHVIVRVDVKNLETSKVKTYWSEDVLLHPGDHQTFDMAWISEKGNYTVSISVYQCLDVFSVGSFNYTVNDSKIEEFKAEVKGSGDANKIHLEITSFHNLTDVYVLPNIYPTGWIIPVKKIGNLKTNETKKIELTYFPQNFKEASLDFYIIANNGKMVKKIEVKVTKPFDWFPYVFWGLIIGFMISVGLNIYFLKTISISGYKHNNRGRGVVFEKSHRHRIGKRRRR